MCVCAAGLSVGTRFVSCADIDEHLRHTAVSSFANDTRLAMLVKCRDDAGKMQGDLDEVYRTVGLRPIT